MDEAEVDLVKDDWAVGNAGDGTPGVHTEAKAALLVQNSREKRMAGGGCWSWSGHSLCVVHLVDSMVYADCDCITET